MSYEQARALQLAIFALYPSLPVVIRSLGNDAHQEYTCMIEGNGTVAPYYLWDIQDWKKYELRHRKKLKNMKRREKEKEALSHS